MEVPVHTGFADAAMDTLTGIGEFTIRVIIFDVAGLPVAQVIFDVRMHLTWSLFPGK